MVVHLDAQALERGRECLVHGFGVREHAQRRRQIVVFGGEGRRERLVARPGIPENLLVRRLFRGRGLRLDLPTIF